MMVNEDLDAMFKKRAAEAEKQELERVANKGKGKFTDYEKTSWTGLQPQKLKLFRLLGEHPDIYQDESAPSGRQGYDARIVRVAKIIDDKGKKMRMVLPLKYRDDTHIIWRIIDKVNEVEWVKSATDPKKSDKIFPVKDSHPDVFNIINFSGLPPDNPSRKFGLEGKGWSGKEYCIINAIDREKATWHKENKHTVLISKNVNGKKDANGNLIEYAEDGIPAFGFVQTLCGILKFYGFWENFDIGMERTGIQSPPVRVINASKHIEEVPTDLQGLVSSAPLTEEEKAYTRYDLDKIYPVTSYTKLWNRLRITIEMIDAKLNTHFAEELKKAADKEAAEREVANAEGAEVHQDISDGDDSVGEEVEADATPMHMEPPTTRTVTNPNSFELSALPGYSKLKPEEKMAIIGIDAMATETTPFVLKYKDGYKFGVCPECKTKSPTVFGSCPSCGLSFVF